VRPLALATLPRSRVAGGIMRLTSVAALSLAASIASSLALASSLEAQRPRGNPPASPPRTAKPAAPRSGTLSGTLSPRAIGRPAPGPTPIGGLQTRPLNAPRPVGAINRDRGRDGYDDRYRRGDRDGNRYGDRDRNGNGYRDGNRDGNRDGIRRGGPLPRVYGYPYGALGYGLAVADAPLPRGVIYYDERVETRTDRSTWFVTADRPRLRRDDRFTPVQAWVDLIVSDVVCDGYGTCVERESRARAPWVAVCRCYVYTDALGRRWEVE
jgi:hypothetical protein